MERRGPGPVLRAHMQSLISNPNGYRMPDESLTLSYDPFGRLVLTRASGEVHVGVVPVRAFPFSHPNGWCVLCDEDGHEIACLPELDGLPAETRRLLETDLAAREFIPRIERICSVSPGAEPTEWHVVTDRGETRFELNSEDHLRPMGQHAVLITDAHGVRYLIADRRALDAHSRRVVRRYLS